MIRERFTWNQMRAPGVAMFHVEHQQTNIAAGQQWRYELG
jgi:hypothetical protein